MQKKGRKMLHLKEGETKELGEGQLMFPPFSNEGGEIFFFKLLKNVVYGFLKFAFLPFIRNT